MSRIIVNLFAFALLLSMAGQTAQAQRTISRSSEGRVHYEWYENDDDGLEVDIEGEVEFTSDESDIRSISSGGRFRVEEHRGRRVRSLDIRPTRDGLDRVYKVDGRVQTMDTRTRAEMGEIILQVIRETGYKAEERVARILRTDGVDGVLDEISHIRSSSSTARYYTELVSQGDLNTSQLIRVVENVNDHVPSSGSRARFLMTTASVYMADTKTWDAYFETTRRIPSSGDRTRILQQLLELKLGTDGLTMILESARSIPSSGDKSRLLVAAAPQYTTNENLQVAYFDVVNTIPSSGDRTRVLLSLLENGKTNEATIERVFRAAAGIPSSGDRARLLVQTAPLYAGSDAHRAAFFEVVDSIPSSGDHARVLVSLLERKDLNKATVLSIIQSSKGIPSSGDRSRVLVTAAPLMTDDALVEAYLDAAESIPSSGEQGRALTALIRAK